MNSTSWISPKNLLKGIGLCFCYLMISSCVQEADLALLQRDLEGQITKINQEKKALTSEVAQAKDAINESKGLLAKQNTEMKDLFRARAEINQQIKTMRESDLTNLSGDIEQINFKMGQLREDLETRNNQTGTRIEGLESQLNKQTEDLTAQQTQTTALIQQVDKDGTSVSQKMAEFQSALTTFRESIGDLGDKVVQEAERDSRVEAELKKAVAESGALFGGRLDEHDAHVTQLLERTDTHQATLQEVDTLTQAHATNIQELTRTALQLREHQDVMGSLLGKRGDAFIQQTGRLDERLNDLEAHQTTLDQALETNRQNTARHFEDLTASISSMTQDLPKTTDDFATRINTHEQLLNTMTQQIQELQVVQQNLDPKGKFGADVQTINSHLAEVNEAIVSVKDALAQVNTQLSTRIDEQEQHLQQALTSFQSVQGNGETTQANMAHLNQLTETVNKLRDVVTTIGTKFGERVDQHETRLADLAKRINQIHANIKKKKR